MKYGLIGLVVIVLLGVAVAVGWWGIGADGGAPTPSAPGAAASDDAPGFDEAAAREQLAIVQQLQAVIEHHRDARAALADARQLVEAYPDFAPGRVTCAQIMLLTGQGQAAYEQLEAALALDPSNAAVHVLAGSVAMQLERVVDAQHHYSQAVGLEPRQPHHRLLLASAYAKQNRFDQARNELLRALQLDSSLHGAHAALADLYAQQNKAGPALDQIERALALLPSGQAARRAIYVRRKSNLLRRANKPDQALAALKTLAVEQLATPEVSEELVLCWMMLAQPAKAAAHYEQVLIVYPAAEWAASGAAEYRLKAGQLDQARRDVEALRRINPRSPHLHELEQAIKAAG